MSSIQLDIMMTSLTCLQHTDQYQHPESISYDIMLFTHDIMLYQLYKVIYKEEVIS